MYLPIHFLMIKSYQMFDFVVDRRVSRFLDTSGFIALRKTCHTHYDDEESWTLQTMRLPIHMHYKHPRQKLALHYLLSWSIRFQEPIGSLEWYQRIVSWLKYRVSIKLIHSFVLQQECPHLHKLDLSGISPGPRILWQRLGERYKRQHTRHRYKGLYKIEGDDLYGEQACKRRRTTCLPDARFALHCR